MPTISGLHGAAYRRKRSAISSTHRGGEADGMVDIAMLEYCVREDLNNSARRMAVLRPLKVVIDNYPEGQVEELDAINNPEDPRPEREVPFLRELYIEHDDFMEDPPKKFFRCRRAAKCGCATPISSPAPKWSRTTPAKSSNCAAPTIRPPRAAMHRMAAR